MENTQNCIQYFTAVVSGVLNATLIVLILKKSPKRLGAYKYLMMCISAFEMFYSLMDVLVSPVFYSYGSTNIIYVNMKKSIFSREMALVMNGIYCVCFGFSLAIFGIHFIYRYLVVSGKKYEKYLKKQKIVYWMCVPIVYGLIWGSSSYFLCYPEKQTDYYLKDSLLEVFDIRIDQIIYLGPSFYLKDETGNEYLAIKPTIALSVYLVELSSSFFVIFYFGVKCYTRINKMMKMSTISSKYARLQTQLFFALVTQAMIPVILMHVPATVMFILAFLGYDIGKTCGLVSMTIALYPAIDPLPTMFIVKDYRGALIGYMQSCCNCAKKRNSSSNKSTSSDQIVQLPSFVPERNT